MENIRSIIFIYMVKNLEQLLFDIAETYLDYTNPDVFKEQPYGVA